MQRFVLALSNLTRWRRMGAAFLAGAVSVASMAPLHLWPVLLVTFPVFVWLLDGCYAHGAISRRSLLAGAATGWAFGFGFFLAGLYWIGHAFLVEAEIFAWLMPFAVTLMPAGLALFFALAAAMAGPLWRPGPARVVALAVAIAITEWLRGNVLTGFPWNAPGYALTGSDAMMQWASLFGLYSLTLLAVLIFAAPASAWGPGLTGSVSPVKRFGFPFLMLLLLAGAGGWGKWRLHNAPVSFVEGVRLRIVQPNIAQKEKWKPENRAAIFQRLMEVSRNGNPGLRIKGVTHLLWPESALPFLLEETPEALNAIAAMLTKGSVFITGAARAERDVDAVTGLTKRLDIFNSLLVMDDKARVLSKYDKAHLVPFGEYLPFQKTLESLGLQQLARKIGGFAPGTGPRLTMAPNIPPFVALICYEIIFPGAIREPGPAPQWLLNVTNDAWFGDSPGPAQHFHQARVRAVEQGLPLVRVANTGISAVTGPYGRIVARLPRGQAAAMDVRLPRAAPDTVFVKWGGEIFILLLLSSLVAWRCLATRRHLTA